MDLAKLAILMWLFLGITVSWPDQVDLVVMFVARAKSGVEQGGGDLGRNQNRVALSNDEKEQSDFLMPDLTSPLTRISPGHSYLVNINKLLSISL